MKMVMMLLLVASCASRPQIYPNQKMKQVGREAAKGGGAAEAISPDQFKKNYVNQCLAEKGYHVLGWN